MPGVLSFQARPGPGKVLWPVRVARAASVGQHLVNQVAPQAAAYGLATR
jgi:hypothetical protein